MLGQHHCWRWRCSRFSWLWFAIHQGPAGFQVFQQGLWIATQERLDELLLWQGERVEPTPPVVADQLVQQLRGVVQVGLLKQVAAVQRKAGEHASAPAVDGVDGRLVHALRGHVQLRCAMRPLLGLKSRAQVLQKRI